MSEARIGLLSGPVGVGKTTVAERAVSLAQQGGLACGGLLAPAIRNHLGQKVGIWGVDICSSERRILARTDRKLGGSVVGPYSFDAKALVWAVSVLEEAAGACDLLVVDEIGKLELWQAAGLAPILPRLAAGDVRRSLVVVRDSLLTELQARLEHVDQVLFEVNERNRGELAPRVLRKLVDPQPDHRHFGEISCVDSLPVRRC